MNETLVLYVFDIYMKKFQKLTKLGLTKFRIIPNLVDLNKNTNVITNSKIQLEHLFV